MLYLYKSTPEKNNSSFYNYKGVVFRLDNHLIKLIYWYKFLVFKYKVFFSNVYVGGKYL